jgi:translocation protein SEC66
MDPPAPEHLLKAALLRRAVTDITRIHSMREDKQAATVLVQKGSVGDDLLTRLLAAEKELEAEILEVVGEANSFKEGWGAYIFQTASEMLANEKTGDLYHSLAKRKAELGWYFSRMFRRLLMIMVALKYGKKQKTQTGESPALPTSPSTQTVEIPTASSGTTPPSSLVPPTPQSAVLSAGSDADDSPSSTRSAVRRILCMSFL